MRKILFICVLFATSILLFFAFYKKRVIPVVNNSYSSVKYYNNAYLPRYETYKKKYPHKKIEQIIIEVNIGLDMPFYSNTQETKNYTRTILVNKYNYLSKDYIPNDLVTVDNTKLSSIAAKAFLDLKKDAKKNDLNIVAISGYRSYSYQNNLYNKYVKIDGLKKADTYSSRAGFSEHQTGLAIDVSNGQTPYMNFEKTDEFIWMNENAYKYGFILRYPKNKEYITGYTYESWHYRYTGVDISSYIKKHNITYDEYYVKFVESKR